MSIDLDDIQLIQSKDKQNVLQATKMLWNQCEQAWQETQHIQLPNDFSKTKNVVIAGMGGSHLGAQLINAVFSQDIAKPLIIQHEYQPPGFIGQDTLFIATSFSGTTEEIISQLKVAEQKQAKIICISSGGNLAEVAIEKEYPHYTFESTYNPSKIPRYGSGYLFISQLVFLSKIGAINFDQVQLEQVVDTIKQSDKKYFIDNPTLQNPAKQLALSLFDREAILVASEHLTGSAYIFKNQLNESAKQLSTLHTIPELNHHLLEGLGHPKSNLDHLSFTFFESILYHPRVITRYQITQNIIREQGFKVSSFVPQSTTKITQAFETLTFTSYVAIYLSILNQVDPGPNPWVDKLKHDLNNIT